MDLCWFLLSSCEAKQANSANFPAQHIQSRDDSSWTRYSERVQRNPIFAKYSGITAPDAKAVARISDEPTAALPSNGASTISSEAFFGHWKGWRWLID